MTLYEMIVKRRSVRKYTSIPLNDEVLSDIKNRLENVRQLKGQNARFEIVTSAVVSDDRAPHYILAYCEKSTEAYINVGYCLQEIDLYIQSLGLGSLWLGTAKPKGNEAHESYCIMLAFGNTDVPLRNGAEDFRRLEADKISNIDNKIIQAARLAPSAMNSQPWQLDLTEGAITVNYFGRGLLKGILKKKHSKIDIGIITKHIELALHKDAKMISSIETKSSSKGFSVEISYAN